MAGRKPKAARAQQLDLAQLFPELEVEPTTGGITLRLKQPISNVRPAPDAYQVRVAGVEPRPLTPWAEPVRYDGVRIVNGRVIREGRHADSHWQFAGLAGAVPRHVRDYPADVVLERRTDADGVVRLLPAAATAGESLADLQYAVVDVETTGAGFGRGHRITEIAIVQVNAAGAVVDEYHTLVNPQRPIPAVITALTQIHDGMVRTAPVFGEIAGEVVDRLQGRVFVAHNAGFDWGFISMELLRALGLPLRGRMLCTVRMARKLVPELSRRSLDQVCCYFGIDNEARHRALGDARATAAAFAQLLRRIREREIDAWFDLQKVLYARGGRRRRRATPSFFDPAT